MWIVILIYTDYANPIKYAFGNLMVALWFAIEDCGDNCYIVAQGLKILGDIIGIGLSPVEMFREEAMDKDGNLHLSKLV